MGDFPLKSHRSETLLDPHCMCVRTFTMVAYDVTILPSHELLKYLLNDTQCLKRDSLVMPVAKIRCHSGGRLLLNICFILLTFIHAMQNGWNWMKHLLRSLTQFCNKVQQIFLAQPFSISQISYTFVSFMKDFALHKYCCYLLQM